MSLLNVRDLRVYYRISKGMVRAVDGVNLYMDKGDFLGLAGESGCGKTTLALSITRLLPDNAKIISGSILFDGVDLLKLREDELRENYRWKRISIVFQGAMNALNPVFRVGDQIVQAICTHENIGKKEAWERVERLFSLVGLSPERAKDYPHEFSGGMKQRAIIALALACNPDLIIADEPVTALDVIVQAQILELIRSLRDKLGLSMIIITHDLSVIADTCNKAAIMYAGKIVEFSDIVSLFKNPLHPYSQGLLANYPSIEEEAKSFEPIGGRPPDLLNPPSGCRFHPRCPYVMDVCRRVEPNLIDVGGGHLVACHRVMKS
ncbi:MAG: ABC transporter ATP-binding protein [archaeon GB-1867-035]|nr:ABC transporter ATP-binding protein [Candidatus Culexmicrobium profundum]